MTSEYQVSSIQPSFDNNSRYANSPVYEAKGSLFLNTLEVDPVSSDVIADYHTVDASEVGRLELIAYRVYGVTSLWWLIAHANQIIDPFTEVVAGKILKIPPREEVFNVRG